MPILGTCCQSIFQRGFGPEKRGGKKTTEDPALEIIKAGGTLLEGFLTEEERTNRLIEMISQLENQPTGFARLRAEERICQIFSIKPRDLQRYIVTLKRV